MSEPNLIALMTMNILGQASENIGMPLWINRIDGCVDPFVIFQITTLEYPVFFCVSAAVLMKLGFPYLDGDRNVCMDSRISWKKFFKFTWNQELWIMSVGLCDALNGAFVVPASPADKTPPVITALLTSVIVLPMIYIKYKYGLAVYMIIYPVASRDGGLNTKIYWWLIFLIGAMFGVFYNVQQEYFFKKTKLQKFLLDYIVYLCHETFYLMVFGWLLTPLNFIPGYGYAEVESVSCNYHDTFYYSFTKAIGFNLMFNIGYYFAFIASAYINQQDALIGSTTGIIANALVIAISYPIAELTPDKTVVQIGLLPITFILGSMASWTYILWSRSVKEDRLILSGVGAITNVVDEVSAMNVLRRPLTEA